MVPCLEWETPQRSRLLCEEGLVGLLTEPAKEGCSDCTCGMGSLMPAPRHLPAIRTHLLYEGFHGPAPPALFTLLLSRDTLECCGLVCGPLGVL